MTNIFTASLTNQNYDIISTAHSLFIKHASEIFGELEPATGSITGETVYADIETLDVWRKLVSGIRSDAGQHYGVITVAKTKTGRAVGFVFGIYHSTSNCANLTYAAIDLDFRGGKIFAYLENEVLQTINKLSARSRNGMIDGIFVEAEKGKKINKVLSKRGMVGALTNWHSPLLIGDGAGGLVPQNMNLLVKWNPLFSIREKLRATVLFVEDFYALYSGQLYKGGDVSNNNKLYPKTENLGYQTMRQQKLNLKEMKKDAQLLNDVKL